MIAAFRFHWISARIAPIIGLKLPQRIGFIIPFGEHEWYKNLSSVMQDYAAQLKIDFEFVDAHQSLLDEVNLRRREIARLAAGLVKEGDVILIDGGPIASYLAEELVEKTSLTIITNSISVFEILRATRKYPHPDWWRLPAQ